ncbi:MAG: hypothetical protein Ct9H300mP12_06640 [Acidimicrobiales bacterium]|nr:MAG: hypothetical protein Ct9H300mP12_06640 [Acidimicrobiales bacterium]
MNDRCCLTVCTAPTSSVGACTQPTFPPVRPKDLPPEEMVTVVRPSRAGLPAECGGAVVGHVLVDLVGNHHESWAKARRAISPNSAWENTLPVGLCGVFTMIIRVDGLMGPLKFSRVERVSGGRSVTARRPTANSITAAYRSK